MMDTRAAFYATEPSNAAVYAPVEACGAHEWSCIAHGWRAVSAACGPKSDASTHGQDGGGGGALTEGGLARQASAHGHGQEVCMQSQRELTSQFGVSNDRAACAQKHGQPLREGFSIVKVRATRCACAISHISRDLPHAYLARSPAGTTVPVEITISHISRDLPGAS